MLTSQAIEQILTRLPSLTIGVLGDLFLDRYLDIDAALTEPSIETGLGAYQVVCVRSYPGAAGTVINNLVALGVGRVVPISVIGDDGEGYELRQALARLIAVERSDVYCAADRRTPTYTKPILRPTVGEAHELNRLDFKNRTPISDEMEDQVLRAISRCWPRLDALVVLDQVTEADCGVVTDRVRDRVIRLASEDPAKFVLADSRGRIGGFRAVALKPNAAECRRAVSAPPDSELNPAVMHLARWTGRPVFCTCGPDGIRLCDPTAEPPDVRAVPGYPVSGPVDPVGAGDSTSAGIACAVAAGLPPEDAAAFGNLVASITVQQIGTTGTASPEQVRARWREVNPQG